MKKRLDIILVERGIIPSREKARASIMCGDIAVNGERIRKPATLVDKDSEIELVQAKGGYVSRGGIKLEGALRDFALDVKGAHCLDIGASLIVS